MNRAEKIAAVEGMHEAFASSAHVFLTSFRGLSVNQANDLRRKVNSVGGRYRVIKNRLAKRAAEGTPAEAFRERLAGPCAIAMHDSDPVVLAKTLAEFAKENPQLEVVAGVVDAKDVLDADGFNALSKLPGLLELRGQLLALFQTPATTLLRLLNTPATQLSRVVQARGEEGDGQ